VADDNYIRESILNPQAKIAAGFQPIMPTFQGQVNEDDLIRLLAYVRTINADTGVATAVESPASAMESRGAPTTTAAPATTTGGTAPSGAAPAPATTTSATTTNQQDQR
jgi:hypothetical protein